MLVCAMGETTGAGHRRSLAEAGMPVFATPEQAVRGFLHLVQDRRNRAAARELPPGAVLAVAPDRDGVRTAFATMRRTGRLASTQDEALAALDRYGIPVAPTRVVATAEDAAAAAAVLGFPAVVKLRQSEHPNARASNGLALDLHDAREVGLAAALLDARRARQPGIHADGLLVQRQAPRSRELKIRVGDDATFGPVISFGQGGTTADIVHDNSADLPPLNLALARGLIARTRVAAMLAGFRDMPAADTEAVAETLVRISQLVVDFPEIAELEVNPLFADADGVLAVDAWLRLRQPDDTGGGLAITPYPNELEELWTTRDGVRQIIRPIRPEDAEEHGAFFNRLSPQDIRYRFFSAMRELSPEQMARLTQVDYDREMAFIAVQEASGETVGVARLVCESEDDEGEFAVIVQADMKGKGVASHLMRRLIDWARGRGVRAIVGPCWRTTHQCWPSCAISDFRCTACARSPTWWRRGCRWSRLTTMETSAIGLAAATLRAARRHAIVYVLGASATFTLGSALVKALTAEFPVLEIVLFRSAVGFLAMLPMIMRHGGLAALKTRRPVGHVMRTVYGFIGTVTSVYGFGVLPLVTVTALGFAMPLFLTILSVPLLGERVGPRRVTAGTGGPGRCTGDAAALADQRRADAAWRGRDRDGRRRHLVAIDDQHPPDGRRGREECDDRRLVQPGNRVPRGIRMHQWLGDAEPSTVRRVGVFRAVIRYRAIADDRGLSRRGDDPGCAIRVWGDHLCDRARHRDLG